MGLFDWLTGRRRRRARRVQTSAQPRRRRPGAAAQRYLERVEQLEAVQQRRKRAAPQRARKAPRPSDPDYDAPTIEIPKSVQREAERRYQKRQRAERQERERAERERIRTQEAERRMEARLMARAQKARDRTVQAYMTHGATRAEAEAMADRQVEYEEINPRRRVGVAPRRSPYTIVRNGGQLRTRTNPARSGLSARGERLLRDIEAGALPPAELYDGLPSSRGGRIRVRRRGGRYSVTHEYGGRLPPIRMATDVDATAARDAAHRLYGQTLAHDYDALFRAVRRNRNPGISAVAAEIAKDVLKGGLIAAAQEELKEWRQQAHKGGARHVIQQHRRRNPARYEPDHPDPRLREISRRFHGVETEILHLDPDQRRPPPTHVVRIGEERSITYRPSRRSERGDADWEHEAGDRGMFRRNASGRRILVADERGRVYVLQGSSSMRFDPDQGLVG